MLRPEWAGSKETNQTKHTPYLIHKIELWGIYCKHFGETWYYNAIALYFGGASVKLHQPRLWFITGGYLVKHWFLPAAARARGQSNDLNREILASNLFNCRKEVINAPPVPSVPRCIHIVFRHKNIWEYQWSNFIYNCMSTFLHYVHCKDALLDCSAPGGERCESLTGVDEIDSHGNIFLWGDFVIFMKYFLPVKYFFSVWPVLVLLHWPGMAVDCDDRKLKTGCRGGGGTPRTILKQKDPFGAFCCILTILVIKTVLGGTQLMEMSKKKERKLSYLIDKWYESWLK